MPRCGAADQIGYVPGELHITRKSGWYIDYYVKHPELGRLIRKRIKLNQVHDLNIRKAYARDVLRELNRKLAKGWTPWIVVDAPKAHVLLKDALDGYDRSKRNQLRHSSPYTYTSMVNMLREWAKKHQLMDRYAHAFNRSHAVDFMNYLCEQRHVGNRTYNNYLLHMSMLFKWMSEQCMRSDNPFSELMKRKEPRKSRTFLTEEDRREMARWIAENDPRFWLPCMLVYGTLIRPAEIRRLKVGHVDLANRVVHVPPEESKTGQGRTPAIPDWMFDEMMHMGLVEMPKQAFLVGKGMIPCGERIGRNVCGYHWTRMRQALAWPSTKQFYSLRDTGIIQLLRDGVNILDVAQQAGHEDIHTTNEYLKHAFPTGPRSIREKATSLQASTPLVAQPLYPKDQIG